MQRLCLVMLALVVATGCGSRCKDVQRARDALNVRSAIRRDADVRVQVPFARANALIGELLAQRPLEAPLALPAIGPLRLDVRELVARVAEVRVLPGAPGRVRFAVRVEVRDARGELTALAIVAEVEPQVARDELSVALSPDDLIAVRPVLDDAAKARLGAAIAARLPGRLPRPLVDEAAKRVAESLTGAAYDALRATLLVRLGEVTRVRLRLPDVPVERTRIRSTADALVVEIATSLPVRAGLAPAAPPGATSEVSVEVSGSTVAELANWAIDRGIAPRWYSRSVEPRADGEFRPRFDYVASDRAHPFKVYSFQERGGCSYFRVGVRAAIAMRGDRLEVTALDRALEAQRAHPVIEAAAWVKYFLAGAIDRSKRVAAHTQLTIAGRTLETRVVGATIAGDDVRFALALAAK